MKITFYKCILKKESVTKKLNLITCLAHNMILWLCKKISINMSPYNGKENLKHASDKKAFNQLNK